MLSQNSVKLWPSPLKAFHLQAKTTQQKFENFCNFHTSRVLLSYDCLVNINHHTIALRKRKLSRLTCPHSPNTPDQSLIDQTALLKLKI